MNVWPLKFRELAGGDLLFADDAGGFFLSDQYFLERYAGDQLNPVDQAFLSDNGHAFVKQGDADWTSFAYRWSRRQHRAGALSYVILVPTLRCNLACGYCQVSRAAETARGYDWTEETLAEVLAFLDREGGEQIKVEFQGGEPLLRVDMLERVRAFCRERFKAPQFVVCTNLQRLGEREWAFLVAEDTFISTSLDGDSATHQRQRTHGAEATAAFFANLAEAVRRFGPERISALPTIDIENPPSFDGLVDAFEAHGIRSIYLRPVNYQGFARRSRPVADHLARWNRLYGDFIDFLIARNERTGTAFEEYYFSHCLKRVLRPGIDGHVDLRNPTNFASDYMVVDHDGRLYPTDEARMLTRIGLIDLAIGTVAGGVDKALVASLNGSSLNNFDADCIHCVYQPFCGTDAVDDVSRYGRIDLPRPDTWFCGRHTAVFDKVFEVMRRKDAAAQASLAHWLDIGAWRDDMLPVHL
jgi:His-Xaa-Ser system radical SAM maturase HxsB